MKKYFGRVLGFTAIFLGIVVWSFAAASSHVQAEDDGGNFNRDDYENGNYSNTNNSNSSSSDDGASADNTATAIVSSLGPYGGNTWDVAIDSSAGYVYTVAKESSNGFYRSNDGGVTWMGLGTSVDYGGSTSLEINSATGDVYVVFTNGLYKSSDHGATFTKILDDSGMALLYAQDQLMLGSNTTAGAVKISTDDGSSFTEAMVASDEYIWSLASSPTMGTFFAITYTDTATHLYKTTNSGASWTQVSIPTIAVSFVESHVCANPTNANHIIVTGGNSNTSYQTTDGGSTWSAISPQAVGCSFDTTGRAYIGGQYSDNTGTSWASMGQDSNDQSTALGGHNLTVDPSNVHNIYADGMPGLSKSTDRGVTWTDVNQGIQGVTISDVSQANNKDIVWAAAYNGIAKTTNFTTGTPTWEFPVLPDPGTAIWVKPDDANIVVVGEIGALKRTVDGGITWSANLVSEVTHGYQVNQIIQDVSNSNVLYAAVMNGEPNTIKKGMVLKSSDVGATWENMNILGDASAQTIAQATNGDLYVGAGADSGTSYKTGVYKYSNGSWEYLSGSPAEEIVKIAIDPSNDSTIYAVASIHYGNNSTDNFGFYISTDAGVTWTKKTSGLEKNRQYSSLAIQASTTPTTLYLGAQNYSGQGVLYKSSDNGETWGTLYTGLKEQTFYSLLFDGVEIGSSTGIFDVKSQGTLKLTNLTKQANKGEKVRLRMKLQDAVTDKKLAKKKVVLYRKVKNKLKVVRKVKTNKKGVAEIKLQLKAGKYQAKWTPNTEDSNEYAGVQSKIVKVTF